MNKEVKIHIVPTDDKSSKVWLDKTNSKLAFNPVGIKDHKPQHLYVTVAEKIKESDWVYWTDPEGLTSDINQVISVDEEMIFLSHPEHSETESLPHECRKIIATTDPKLNTEKYITGIDPIGEDSVAITRKVPFKLPQIQESFIEEYCKAGGIETAMVEYEQLYVKGNYMNTCVSCGCIFYKTDELGFICKDCGLTIKTDSNNCIIIHPIEEKMYSKEELPYIIVEILNKLSEEEAHIEDDKELLEFVKKHIK